MVKKQPKQQKDEVVDPAVVEDMDTMVVEESSGTEEPTHAAIAARQGAGSQGPRHQPPGPPTGPPSPTPGTSSSDLIILDETARFSRRWFLSICYFCMLISGWKEILIHKYHSRAQNRVKKQYSCNTCLKFTENKHFRTFLWVFGLSNLAGESDIKSRSQAVKNNNEVCP